MKTVGLVGGLGPESTIDYYRSIIDLYQKTVADETYPHIVIDSVDVNRALRLFEANNLSELARYFIDSTQRLAGAGSDFALLTANTPHIVFDEVRRCSPLPLISIVEAACDEAKRQGLRTLLLIGTRFTMRASFYHEVFARQGLTIVTPTEEEQAYLHDKYVNELLKGIFLSATREGLLEIIARSAQRHGADGVILGGTELPLILREQSLAGIPLLDTTQIHVRAVVSKMLS